MRERERKGGEAIEDRVLFPLQIFIFRSALESCLLRQSLAALQLVSSCCMCPLP